MNKRIRPFLTFINPFRVVRGLRYAAFRLTNWRRGRFKKMDFILIRLPSELPALPEKRSFVQRQVMGDPPMSLYDLDQHLRQIAADPRPRGVAFLFPGDLSMGLADLQTLRESIVRFRAGGKQAVAYAQGYSMNSYYVACACDQVLLQTGSTLMTLGLLQAATYQADALEAIGVKFEAVAISPYKSAAERLSSNAPSPESLDQLNWLLDSRYEQIRGAMLKARGLTGADAAALIDDAPHNDQESLERGYVDAVLNEEGLAEHLEVEHLIRWEIAGKKLLREWKKRQRRYIAVIPIKGAIMPGASANPPIKPPVDIPFIGSERAGDQTVVQQVRRVMADEDAAGVILYVDSPGGSGAASEAMASALRELSKTRPLITYMHNVAASGGYYVATPTQHIIAQPGTITGSIGVLSAIPNIGGVFQKLRLNRVELSRGENASIFGGVTPVSDKLREKFRADIEYFYAQFLRIVAENRGKTPDEIHPIAAGRVWTGAQALDNGLVDELGDLHAALTKIRAECDLPDDAPVRVIVSGDKRPLAPRVAEQADPAAWIDYALTNIRGVYNGQAAVILPFMLE